MDLIVQANTFDSNAVDKGNRTMDEGIEPYSLDIAERAKMRSRGKSSATVASLIPVGDVIELTSDSEDEISFLRPSRSKSKESTKQKGKEKATPVPTRRSPKRKKALHEAEPPGSTLATLPIPTSDPAPSSQLPPSDPPFPSSANAPPTSLQNLSPPSSPLPVPPSRKRKRAAHITDDEGDTDGKYTAGTSTTASTALMPPPPPAFFASSSPPAGPSSRGDTRPDESLLDAPHESKKKGKKNAVNDGGREWAEEPKSKPKSKGKKKVPFDDDEGSDWAEKSKSKPKPKPKPKPKAKKKATGTEGEPIDLPAEPKPKAKRPGGRGKKMEVVIEVPSPNKRLRSTDNDKPDIPPPIDPATVFPELEDSELSILESDPERGSKPSHDQRPNEAGIAKSSSSSKPGAGSVSKAKGKGKKRAVLSDDEDEDDLSKRTPPSKKSKGKAKATDDPISYHETPPPDEPDRDVNSKGPDRVNKSGSFKVSSLSSTHSK